MPPSPTLSLTLSLSRKPRISKRQHSSTTVVLASPLRILHCAYCIRLSGRWTSPLTTKQNVIDKSHTPHLETTCYMHTLIHSDTTSPARTAPGHGHVTVSLLEILGSSLLGLASSCTAGGREPLAA